MTEKTITFTIDGVEVQGRLGQTIMQAADEAGLYIPRLCFMEGLIPHGSCRLCTVSVNGRPQTACTHPIAQGMEIQNKTEELHKQRCAILDMLFVEGNHFCMICEKSGNCELQAQAYRHGILAPQYPFQFPKCEIDATHPDVFIDRNRCILCARCVQASIQKDGKHVFDFVGRGAEKSLVVNADVLGETDLAVADKAAGACPVGAIIKKRVGFATPVGKRLYDKEPIGSDIEKKA
jgi:[NiFe] hydrogenase diaphorase moiety small subunit